MADLKFGFGGDMNIKSDSAFPPNLWYVLFLHHSTSSPSLIKLH